MFPAIVMRYWNTPNRPISPVEAVSILHFTCPLKGRVPLEFPKMRTLEQLVIASAHEEPWFHLAIYKAY